MKSIYETLVRIQSTPDCRAMPIQGWPSINPTHVLPDDLKEFYRLCGGVSLFNSSAYGIEIVPAAELVLANPVIFIGIEESDLEKSRDDISWSWYIIGRGDNSQSITIDLASERLGRCYDSFWDCHALPGSSSIIARSFSELLENLLFNKGQHWYWLQPDFHSLGDAYESEIQKHPEASS